MDCGTILIELKKFLTSKINTKKRREYLATKVVNTLEIFVEGCAKVVQDDGTFMGQAGLDGYHSPQAALPEFLPLSLDVDWQSINANLMNKILRFPNKIHFANSKIDNVGEHSSPPEYFEFYKERQYQHSLLGIEAIKIIFELNQEAGFTEHGGNLTSFEAELFKTTLEKEDAFLKRLP